MKYLFCIALAATCASCAPSADENLCVMPMTNNPNVINVRQQQAMPGMGM